MERREFLARIGRAVLGLALMQDGGKVMGRVRAGEPRNRDPDAGGAMRIFLAGDVMSGRGIDQILPRSVDPSLFEPYVKDARSYVQLAREAGASIPDEVPYEYIWGDALARLAATAPHARIVNLETAVTTSDGWDPDKSIHYRMHPGNVDSLLAADLDVCTLGNNHVLDWGREGLLETLDTLQEAGLATPGAGRDEHASRTPAALDTTVGRLLVFSYASPDAGVPVEWRAGEERPGVNLLTDLGAEGADRVADEVGRHRKAGDRVVVSIHWGGNWGYEVPDEHREFARRLIDLGAADVIHGHSSHHPKGIEVHDGRLILYGAGDLLNDYEGIRTRQQYRKELVVMYFAELSPSGTLSSLTMSPMEIRDFRLNRAARDDAQWLARTLDRESRRFGVRVEPAEGGLLALDWE